MEILDSSGRPIWREGKPVMQEIASVERDINRTHYGKVLRNEDDTLLTRGGTKGLKIYDEVKRDAHAGAVLAKRKLAVTSRPWRVIPASDKRVDKKAAELVESGLRYLRFNSVRKRLLEATLKGFAVSEIMWEVRDGFVLPSNIMARDARRFKFDLEGGLRLLTRSSMVDGEEMPGRKFIVHRRGADDDSPYGLGVGHMLFFPVWFKRQGITFWLTFADKFGSPTLIGKYPGGAGLPEQRKLKDALRAVAQDAGVTIPDGMEIELLEAARSGSVDTYEKLVRYMDEQISKAVLGETMSTTAASTGLGSSQADVQNDVRLEVAVDDGNELDETLNDTVVRWIVEYNMPGAGLPKLETDFSEPEDMAKRATRDKALFDMGFEPTDEYILETYGEGWRRKPKPEPEPFDAFGLPQLGGPAGQAPQRTNRAENPAEEEDDEFAEGTPLQKAARAQNVQLQAALADAGGELAQNWRALLGPRVDDLRAMLDSTGDLQLFRDRMSELLDAEPDSKAVEDVARAMFTAHAMGRGKAGLAVRRSQGVLQRLAALIARRR